MTINPSDIDRILPAFTVKCLLDSASIEFRFLPDAVRFQYHARVLGHECLIFDEDGSLVHDDVIGAARVIVGIGKGVA